MAVLATDTFTRADGELGASWDVITGEAGFAITTNQIGPTNINNDATESNNSVTWPNDQYVQCVIILAASGGAANSGIGVGVAARCATGARTYYRAVVQGTTGNGTEIAKMIAGVYTALANQAASWVPTDVVYLSAVGAAPATLQVKRNGSNLFSTTDAAIASGRAGVSYSSTATTAVIDTWEGGDFASAAQTITVQGAKWKWYGQTLRINRILRVNPAQKKWRGQSVVQVRGVIIAAGQSRWQAQSMRVGRVLTLSAARMQWRAQTLQFPRTLILATARMQWQVDAIHIGGLVVMMPAHMQWQAKQGVAQRGGVSGGRRGYFLGMQRGYPRRQAIIV